MKLFGVEFKFNGFDIWHSGNFNPSNKSDVGHTHVKANITDFPTSMPANGGNADTVDNKHASDFTPYASQSTTVSAATSKWVRIAQSASGIARNSGIFAIDWAVNGQHGKVIFTTGCHYGDATGTYIEEVHLSSYGTIGIQRARVVYHATYTGNYAYVEIYCANNHGSNVMSVGIKLIDSLGWSLITPIDGSIPSGYSNKELTFIKGIATTGQIKSDVATGTAPLIVSSTTLVTNLNADLLDGYNSADFALVSHTHTKSQITDMPTKLSEFINDIGAGGGVKITTSSIAPSSPSPGDFWYQVI